MDNREVVAVKARVSLLDREGTMDKQEFVKASVELEGTMDNREVVKLVLDGASVSLLAAARDLLQFLPGFADKPGD